MAWTPMDRRPRGNPFGFAMSPLVPRAVVLEADRPELDRPESDPTLVPQTRTEIPRKSAKSSAALVSPTRMPPSSWISLESA